MTEWNIIKIEKFDYPTSWFTDTEPPDWGLWDLCFFKIISSYLGEPVQYAHLIDTECSVENSAILNCTETCSKEEELFKNPENLWNCVMLATLAVQTVDRNDTVQPGNESEANNIFNFGSLEDFHQLRVLDTLRGCLWESCSTFDDGKCVPAFGPFQSTNVTADTIIEFGNVLNNSYCEGVDFQIDADITGPGVLLSSIIQSIMGLCCSFLFLVLALPLPVLLRFDKKSLWKAYRRPTGPKRYVRIWKRLFTAISSILVDLQEAQALYSCVLSVAEIVTFSNYTSISESMPVLNYVANLRVSQGIVAASFFSLLLTQALLQLVTIATGYGPVLYGGRLGFDISHSISSKR
ncbi:uncharacterized protein FTJAE_12687 [Fusarium tjaetaba]|uniref:Uncharacterized protein n=1 Tax=Fusarium tjaetaba TaxID=1567544 RepID=A0A8H5QMP9_9HYPO|nr:uncharacterized protein FTJAE_12687 [Fusarium tjaetaba]KAF5617317.1 hypothetical protein FTJAE_12687 [Fusarium tjaetaba]